MSKRNPTLNDLKARAGNLRDYGRTEARRAIKEKKRAERRAEERKQHEAYVKAHPHFFVEPPEPPPRPRKTIFGTILDEVSDFSPGLINQFNQEQRQLIEKAFDEQPQDTAQQSTP